MEQVHSALWRHNHQPKNEALRAQNMDKTKTIRLPLKTKEKTHSFGEYYDAQYKRLREMLSNKDRKQHMEYWEEREKWTKH